MAENKNKSFMNPMGKLDELVAERALWMALPKDSREVTLKQIAEDMAEANPNPIIAKPVAKPLLSGNHLTNVETGVIYPIPSPHPPITP